MEAANSNMLYAGITNQSTQSVFKPTFVDTPQIELLQWLARGSLKQNLPRAIRLWVWLRYLYGQDPLQLSNSFTFAQWRDAFFTYTHPKGETIPQLHDVNCPCTKTTATWLLQAGIVKSQWQKSLLTHTGISEPKLNKILQQRLFGVTRRSLQADLEILAEMGWLEYRQQKYHRVQKFPSRPMVVTSGASDELNFLNQEDLAAIAQNHAQMIRGVQRFCFQLDYVIPRKTIDLVDDWQHQLREIWEQEPVPPLELTYNSARLKHTVQCIVYPVCIYYVQRAVYLCALGQSPDRKTDWYNYRLDRIHHITPIEWTNSSIPQVLQQRYYNGNLPSPDEIEREMSQAWGFDFYLPSRLMLLRFDRDHHDRYIRDTVRHRTFEAVTYQEAKYLIQQHTSVLEQQALLHILKQRSSQDAYYRVQYRHLDYNVSMRIRAWRPKAEVIMPLDLRQSIEADVAAEYLLYLGQENDEHPKINGKI